MTAIAKLRTRRVVEDLEFVDTGEPIVIPLELEYGVALECEMIRPPSAEGKRIRLVIRPDQLLPLHKAIKDEMRRQRSQSLSTVQY